MDRARSAVLAVLFAAAGAVPAAHALEPGDRLPDCRKIPLIPIETAYQAEPAEQPVSHRSPSIEDLLLSDGVLILHFCSPRPAPATAKSYMIEELSALAKVVRTVSYPCSPIAVVPLGEKGRQDTQALLADAEAAVRADELEDTAWRKTPVYYEPTFPRPGLYRTFRPGAAAYTENDITTSWTYLVGPDRQVIAVRAPGADGQLYDWLVANLPPSVTPAPRPPTSDLSIPRAETWSWPAFRRTVRRHAAADQLPDTSPYYYLAWSDHVGGTFASPAVLDGRVYVATDSKGLRMLNVDNGNELGSYSVGNSWWTSPAVAGDLVYTISAEGEVIALDRIDLSETWRRDLHGLVTSSPVVSDGALYVGSRNGAVYALDAATGEVLWEFQTGGDISSSPAVADGLVIIGSGDRNLYALRSGSGQQRWALETQGAIDSSPTVAGGDVFVGSFDGCVYSVGLADGELNWRCRRSGWVHSSPAVDDETVFVGTVDLRRDEAPTFDWIDRGTGEVRGSFRMPQAVYSSPTIWADQVLVGCRDGQLYAFDRQMRQTQPLWTYPTGGYVHASPVVVGDTVFIASFDGYLYALRQSKPIRVWQDDDVVPRWFMAALVRELHEQTGALIAQAGAGEPGVELALARFEPLLQQIKSQVAAGGEGPEVLPRDVPPDHPGASFIEYVLTAGLLLGYPDATFKPDRPTTRYEFAMALSKTVELASQSEDVWRTLQQRRLIGVQVEVRIERMPGRPPMTLEDVPFDHWAHGALEKQAARGILLVDEEGDLRGDRRVTLKYAADQWELIADSLRVVRTE